MLPLLASRSVYRHCLAAQHALYRLASVDERGEESEKGGESALGPSLPNGDC